MIEVNENYPIQQSELDSNKEAQQANVHATKKKKIIFWLYILTIVIFLAGISTLSYQIYLPVKQFSTSDNFYFANQVSNEWTIGFIKDIFITPNESCPVNYESAIKFSWSGTGFGCYCPTANNLSFVLEGYCTPSLIQQNCQNMPEQVARTATRWTNSSNICIQRSTVSFNNQERYSGTNKICGSSSSLVIVPSIEPCPLINISFTPFGLQSHTGTATDPNNVLPTLYTTFNSTSPYSFYSYPISKIKVSQYQFCLINEDSGIDPDHSDFILLKEKRGCLDQGNYTKIDSISQTIFYQANPNLNSLLSISGFPPTSNWNYQLGFASLPSWSYQCRHNFNRKFNIERARSQFNFTFYNQYQTIIIFQIVFIILIGLVAFIVILRRIINSSIYPAGYRQKYLFTDFIMSLMRYIIDFIGKGGLLAISIYLVWTGFINWNWFKAASNLNCPDGNPQIQTNIMEPYSQMYFKIFKLSFSMFFICFAMAILDIIHFCFIYKNQLKYYLVETQGKQMVKQQEDELKWMELKELQPDEKHIQNEELRITMAQNLFANDEPNNQKIRKKKKKKFFGKKKDKQEKQQNPIEVDFNSLNPYELDEPAFMHMDSTAQIKDTPANSKRKRKN